MHARVATFEGVDPERVEKQVEQIREAMGSGSQPEGLEDVKGILMLLDRDGRKNVAVALFETEEGMRRGHEALNKMSPDFGEGRRTSVDFYEVPLADLR